MKPMLYGLQLIITRRDSRAVIIVATLLFFFLLLVFQNGKDSYFVLSLTSMPFMERLGLMFVTFFDIRSTFPTGTLILAILGSMLGGINLALAYTYMRIRGEALLKSGLYSGIGLMFAFIGIGCAACGTAFLSVVLSFFGFSAMLNLLPYQGQEIGYIGIIILLIATYVLAKKLETPNVC